MAKTQHPGGGGIYPKKAMTGKGTGGDSPGTPPEPKLSPAVHPAIPATGPNPHKQTA